jgi:hypothetical protein
MLSFTFVFALVSRLLGLVGGIATAAAPCDDAAAMTGLWYDCAVALAASSARALLLA